MRRGSDREIRRFYVNGHVSSSAYLQITLTDARGYSRDKSVSTTPRPPLDACKSCAIAYGSVETSRAMSFFF